MSRPLVYLAGPITGASYGECTDWRQYVQDQLNDNWNVAGMSPMRHKDYLLKETAMGDTYEDQVMSSNVEYLLVTFGMRVDVMHCL